MPYNEKLAERVREQLAEYKMLERKMMGGLVIMINDAMCAGIFNDDVMLRIDPEDQQAILKRKGCRRMEMKGTPMQNFFLVKGAEINGKRELKSWLRLALSYNKKLTK